MQTVSPVGGRTSIDAIHPLLFTHRLFVSDTITIIIKQLSRLFDACNGKQVTRSVKLSRSH